MASEGSVTHWLGQLQAGDPAAVQALWERYFSRLVELVRQKLAGAEGAAVECLEGGGAGDRSAVGGTRPPCPALLRELRYTSVSAAGQRWRPTLTVIAVCGR